MDESFDWNHPGLNWSHFHSLANLLSLRNGGQAEVSSLTNMVLEEDWTLDDNGDENAASLDTRLADQITDSGYGRLKRRFLHCLAELAANKKGGTVVACSAMKEAENNVVIWIARNEGFSDADKLTFDKMAKMLSSLSCNCSTSSITACFQHDKLMPLVQRIHLNPFCGKKWSCIIKIRLNRTIFQT